MLSIEQTPMKQGQTDLELCEAGLNMVLRHADSTHASSHYFSLTTAAFPSLRLLDLEQIWFKITVPWDSVLSVLDLRTMASLSFRAGL